MSQTTQHDPNAAPKRIVICCDGTWQSSVTGQRNVPSNITRMCRSLANTGKDENNKTWQQIVFYDAGIGTGALSQLEQARQGGTGDGLIVNVIEAYNFIVNNYDQGDKVYCFGFSRGAFTARAVAGLVTDVGILKPESMQHFPEIWATYQKNTSGEEFRKSKAWMEFCNGRWPMVPKSKQNEPYRASQREMGYKDLTWGEDSHGVEVVGVFDTVGSLGVPDGRFLGFEWTRSKFHFLNVKLSPCKH